MFCSDCGNRLSEGTRFCCNCGAKVLLSQDSIPFSDTVGKTVSQKNALICEMCNSNNIMKEQGYYICASCGTRYSTEEARKLMVNVDFGKITIDSANIKIDNTDKIENYIQLALTEINSGNGEKAREYCERALEVKCDNARIWMVKTIASILLDDNPRVVHTCFDNSVKYLSNCNQRSYILEMITGCVYAYFYNCELLIDMKNVDHVDVALERLRKIEHIIHNASVFFSSLKEFNLYPDLMPHDYLLDINSRISCFFKWVYVQTNNNEEYNLYGLDIISDIEFRIAVFSRAFKDEMFEKIIIDSLKNKYLWYFARDIDIETVLESCRDYNEAKSVFERVSRNYERLQ